MINKKRSEILKYFDANSKVECGAICDISNNTDYYFETILYKQKDINRNWQINKIEIYDLHSAKLKFSYLTDNDMETFLWIVKEEIDYLLYPEFLGGYSIYNTKSNELHSYYSESDPFIWTEITFLSDINQLEVIGCYWACPMEKILYDCTDICNLPYPILSRTYLQNKD